MTDVKILEETVDEDASSKWLTHLLEGTILLLALLLGLAIRFGLYETTIVISKSMEPTILVGDRLLVDHRNSLHHAWRRGDIVMFNAPESWGDTGEDLIKRVIGLPGEIIEVRAGQVVLNGRALTESYIRPDSVQEIWHRSRWPQISTSSWATTATTRPTHASTGRCPTTTSKAAPSIASAPWAVLAPCRRPGIRRTGATEPRLGISKRAGAC